MFAAAGLLLATPSCKKGENDPALSLSSRTARVAGEWTVTGYEANTLNAETDGDTQASNTTLSGSTITTSYTNVSGGTTTNPTSTTSTVDEWSFTFEKDGTWSSVNNRTTVDTEEDYPFAGWTTTNTTVTTNNSNGSWSFVGKDKAGEYKNKERMILNVLTSTYTDQTTSVISDDNGNSNTTVGDTWGGTDNYHSGEVSDTWEIDQLKGKEMIVKMFRENSGSTTVTNSSGSTTTADDNYTMDVTITLTHK